MNEDIFNAELNKRNFTGFVWPTVLMMIVLALYYAVDSVFVANLVGDYALAAMNIAYPVCGIIWGLTVMLAGGASTLVGIEMGKNELEQADSHFSFSILSGVIIGGICTLLIGGFLDSLVDILGATEELREGCGDFLSVFMWGCPFAFAGVLFEFYIRVDGRPGYTIFLYLGGAVVHLGLDILLMGPMNMGLTGAAVANVAGLAATTLVGLAYFIIKETRLTFRRFSPDFKFLLRSFANGSPEFINESSMGILVFFCNIVLVKIAGEAGVAAGAIVLNLMYLFLSVGIGFGAGVLPLLSYYYGAGEIRKIDRVLKYSRHFTIAASVLMAVLVFAFAEYFVLVYERQGSELYAMAVEGLRIASITLLFSGINIYVSSFFMAFGKGLVSSIVSAARGLVMFVPGLFILSWLFGLPGVWSAMIFADAATLAISFVLLRKYSKDIGYRIMGE